MDEFTEVDPNHFTHALVATGIWLGVGAALDVYLLATKKSHLITHVLRTNPGKVFLAVLCLHVMDVLGPADPFRATASAIKARQGISVSISPPLSGSFTGK